MMPIAAAPFPVMVLLVIAIPVLSLTLASIVIATRRVRRASAPFIVDPASCPVTVLLPLCGREAFSRETLNAAFRLDHPDHELVFCVASHRDPVIAIVRDLIDAHPHSRARLLIGEDGVSVNPKLNNCIKGWAAAGSDWVVIADSNVLLPKDGLAQLLSAWRRDSGAVCSMPLATRPLGFWAEVECAFLNTLQARWQYSAEAIGMGFAQGKCMLLYRPLLEQHGGIRALAAEIAEDAAVTKLVLAAGLRVHLVDRPFAQPLGHRRAGDVWARQCRWARLRRVTFPAFFAPEIVSSPALPALLVALGAYGAGISPVLAAATVLSTWYGAEILMAWRLGWHLSARMLLAFAVRDCLIPLLWASAYVTRDVVWRGTPLPIPHGPALGSGPKAAQA